MIRQVQGRVLAVGPVSVTVEVAGFGLEVFTPAPLAFTVGEVVVLLTHLVVKQDGIELYGFSNPLDRDFFELAITVSGVGPKKGLTLLSRAPRENLESAIAKRDIAYLMRVAGLGKKSAEKIAVELSEKMHAHEGAVGGDDTEVFDTLVALGYTEREARKALANIPHAVTGKDARLRAALGNGR